MKKLLAIVTSALLLTSCAGDIEKMSNANKLKIIASDAYEEMGLSEILSDKTSTLVEIDYMPDIEIVSYLNNQPKSYDAILISNSMWTYMLENVYLTESKSLAISPVVFSLKKTLAEKYDLIDKEITNEDIVNLIENEDLVYTMPSAVRTNVGATSYLGFINALAGNPQVLTSQHLQDSKLRERLNTIFKKVERNSGSELYSFEMFDRGECDALVASEASIIKHNTNSSEPLYMLYPIDGVPITDSMLSFIGSADKKEAYLKVRDYLLSDEGREIFNSHYYRTWYGGNTDKPNEEFKKEWGTDTSKILKITSFPSKSVMNEAFNLYIDSFRKPAAITFVLDYSGSMDGKGIKQLKEANSYIFNNSTNSIDYLQFSSDDLVKVIYFWNGEVYETDTVYGNKVESLLEELNSMEASGGTPLYESAVYALNNEFELKKIHGEDYNYSVILMTDGEPTGGTYYDFENWWNKNDIDIPIYTIAFGNARLKELEKVAELTRGKAFDGRVDLVGAFKEIRGYN